MKEDEFSKYSVIIVCGSSRVISLVGCLIAIFYNQYNRSKLKRQPFAIHRSRRPETSEITLNKCDEESKILDSFVLPIYVLILIAFFFALLLESSLFLANRLKDVESHHLGEWSLFEWVHEGVFTVLLQSSLSVRALGRSLCWSLGFLIYGGLCAFSSFFLEMWISSLIFHGVIVFFYLLIYFKVILRSRRGSVEYYCLYMALYRFLNCALTITKQYESSYNYDIFYYLSFPCLISLGICEFVWIGIFYLTLLVDTRYWRGIGEASQCKMNQLLSELHQPIYYLDKSDHVISSNLQTMIEVNRRIVFDFSYLDTTRFLASGASSTVFYGTLKNRPVAIKVFLPIEISAEEVESFSKEAAISSSLKHPNIVETIGLVVCPPRICLISEYCSFGTLHNKLKTDYENKNHLSELLKLSFARDATAAISYIHKLGYIHRDIKSLNYLVTDKLVVKLSDFGLSRMLPQNQFEKRRSIQNTKKLASESDDDDDPLMTTYIGTRQWMAPEMWIGTIYSEKADIYSLSLVLWEIWSEGAIPYSEIPVYELRSRVIEGEYRPCIPSDCPPSYRRILEEGWSRNPSLRPSASDILSELEVALNSCEHQNVRFLDDSHVLTVSEDDHLLSSETYSDTSRYSDRL